MAGTDGDMREAFRKGDTQEVERLIRAGVDVNNKENDGVTPIHCAAENGHTDTVQLLLDHGANVNVKDAEGYTPISEAAENGHRDTVRLLLDHGANVDAEDDEGDTPISQAANNGHTDTVKLLLTAGADPHISGYREVRDLLKRVWSEEWEENILSSFSSDENYNASIAADLALNRNDFLIKFIKNL